MAWVCRTHNETCKKHQKQSARLEDAMHIPNDERPVMSTVDKAKNKLQEAKGHVEEAAGKATNDRSQEAKGKKDKASGNLKQAGEKVKDAVRK